MTCNITSRAKQGCRRASCVNYCICSTPSFYTSGITPDFKCGNGKCDPITVEAWNGPPGAPGSTGTSVGIDLCEKLIFWTQGSSSLEVTSGSARVEVGANNVFYGHGQPPDDGPIGITGAQNGDVTRAAIYLDVDVGSFWYWTPANDDLNLLSNWFLLGIGTGGGGNSHILINGDTTFQIAVGTQAGETNQGSRSVALGYVAGKLNQGANSVAVGHAAGIDTQGTNAVAVGNLSGNFNQGNYAIAIGDQAGIANQSPNTICIGDSSACTFSGGIALGSGASTSAINQLSIRLGNANELKTQFNTDVAAGAINKYLIVNHNGTDFKIPLHNF